jgi:hypothetical protein
VPLLARWRTKKLKGKRRRFRLVSLVVLISLFRLPLHGYGQRLRFGGMVAAQVTDTFNRDSQEDSFPKNMVVFGPTFEVGLRRHLSLEANALYRRRLGYANGPERYSSTTGSHVDFNELEARSLEIPVLLEWNAPERLKNLFVGGGMSVRTTWGTYHQNWTTTSLFGTTNTVDSRFPMSVSRTYGGVITAGIDIHTSIFHVRPQIRYTRWIDPSPQSLDRNANALQVLMGISIGK